MMRRGVMAVLLTALALAGAGAAEGALGTDCLKASATARELVPQLFYADDPDSLFDTIAEWNDACGGGEVVQRTRILAAIWDGAFTEAVYGTDILDDLVTFRAVEARHPSADSTDPVDRYDAFTMSLADQMLPHVPRGGLEAFFCLYYSGHTTEALELLENGPLSQGELGRWYANEIEILERPQKVITAEAAGGWWEPVGDHGFVGGKALAGAMFGLRDRDWLLRMALDVRLGRADQPYAVPVGGWYGYSDRFDAVLLAVEAGRSVPVGRRGLLDVFCGVGVDGTAPFSEGDIFLSAVNVALGVGWRSLLGPGRNWTLGLDLRHEWVGERNPEGTPLGGHAWSLRFSIGTIHDQGRGKRLRALRP
jgi:hypothetical protein